MKFPHPISVAEVAAWVNAEVIGNATAFVLGINEIHQVETGDITFVDHHKYYDFALRSAASVVLINQKVDAPAGKTLLYCSDPFTAYNSLAMRFSPQRLAMQRIAPSSILGKNTYIAPTASIGENVRLGNGCIIHAQVVLYANTVVGDNVIIHAGSVVGSDAFYYKNRGVHYDKMHTAGRVVIADDVEIGALCTIDAGVSSDTYIGRGTKLDNLVQIAHDVKIGEHCLLCAQVGVSGNVRIGNYVKLYGKVGTVQNITIGDNVTVLGGSNVGRDLAPGKTYLGSPCQEVHLVARQWAVMKHLPEIWRWFVQRK